MILWYKGSYEAQLESTYKLFLLGIKGSTQWAYGRSAALSRSALKERYFVKFPWPSSWWLDLHMHISRQCLVYVPYPLFGKSYDQWCYCSCSVRYAILYTRITREQRATLRVYTGVFEVDPRGQSRTRSNKPQNTINKRKHPWVT